MRPDEDYEPITQEDIDYYNQDDIRKSDDIYNCARQKYFDKIKSFRSKFISLINTALTTDDSSIFAEYLHISLKDFECDILVDLSSSNDLLSLLDNVLEKI